MKINVNIYSKYIMNKIINCDTNLLNANYVKEKFKGVQKV